MEKLMQIANIAFYLNYNQKNPTYFDKYKQKFVLETYGYNQLLESTDINNFFFPKCFAFKSAFNRCEI